MTRAIGRAGLAAALVLGMAVVPSRAQTKGGASSAMDGAWHFVAAPYFWLAGIEGNASIGSLADVPFEKPFSDIISDFDFGLQAHFEGRRDRFGFGLDLMYTNLGVPVAEGAPIVGSLGLNVDFRQTFAEGFLFYRAASSGRDGNPAHLDLLAGVRYTDSRARLSAEGPSGADHDGDFRDSDWVDALAGVRFRAPLGSRFALLGRGDVAGFGSKLTWNLEGDLAFMASERVVVGAGWRHMDIDYENGDGVAAKKLDVAYDGPRAWFAYTW